MNILKLLTLFGVLFGITASYGQNPSQDTADAMDSSIEDTLSARQYFNMGLYKLYVDWDYQGGKKAALRAIAKDSMFAEAYAHLGWYTILEQDREAAEQYIIQAKMLDPQKASWVLHHAWICYFFGDYEGTEQYIDEALKMKPDLSEGHFLKGMAYYKVGKMEESIQSFQLAARDSSRFYALGISYFLQHKTAEALEVVREVEGKNIKNKDYWLMVVYVLLEEKEKALDWFEECYSRKSLLMPWMQFDPIMQAYLKDEAKFQELVKKIGKPKS